MTNSILWLVAIIAFIAIECISYQLMSIWMAVGALAALIIYWFGGNFLFQFLTFTIVSILLIVLTRPFCKKFINSKTEKTNTDGIIGEKAVVISEISNIAGQGKVKINGMEWSARSDNDEVIKDGEIVEIVKIEGVKLIVKKGK